MKFSLMLCSGLLFAFLAASAQEFETHLDDDLKFLCNRETAYSTGVSDARKGLSRKQNYAQVCTADRERFNAAYMSGYQFGLANPVGPVINEPAPHHPDIEDQHPSSQIQPYTRPPVGGYYNPNVPGYYPNVPPGYNTYNPAVSSVPSSTTHGPDYPGQQQVPAHEYTRPHPVHGLESLHEIYPSARPTCIEGYHGQACGFNCVNSLGNVRCSSSPEQYCKGDNHGNIACGYHCIASLDYVGCAAVPTDTCVSDHNGKIFCGVNCRLAGGGEGVCDSVRYAP